MPINIYGNVGPNALIGTSADENIYGFGGNDNIVGGGGNDFLSGGDGDDRVEGGIAHDIILGGSGDDVLLTTPGIYAGEPDEIYGGAGNDVYYLYSGGNTIVELPNEGFDTIHTYFESFIVPLNVERVFVGSTNSTIIIGNLQDNIIYGFSGADQLYGGDGNDTLIGYVDSNIFTDSSDLLVGGNGDDILDGGAGADTLIGGPGNDRYVILAENGAITDTSNELPGEGLDTIVISGDNFNIVNLFYIPENIENVINDQTVSPFYQAIRPPGDVRVGIIGNSSDNSIRGSEMYDELYGLDGNDTLTDQPANGGFLRFYWGDEYNYGDALFGGRGNDVYYVNNPKSSTLERPGEGIDEVITSAYIYGLQSNIENLTLVYFNGNQYLNPSSPRVGVGNELDNVIRGTAYANELFGREGNDTLFGGLGDANTLFGQQGDDTYFSEAVGDTIIEFAGEGNDTVRTGASSFTLRDYVENLVYTGTGDFIGVGSDGTDNLIQGGAGADSLNGMGGNDILIGGSGADLLLGGAGADQFRYLGGETGFDRIIDFVSGSDKIALSGAGFAHTATVDFVTSGAPAPTSTNSTFLYNATNGMLSYDPDGTGSAAAIQIAQLNGGQTLAAGDLIFF